MDFDFASAKEVADDFDFASAKPVEPTKPTNERIPLAGLAQVLRLAQPEPAPAYPNRMPAMPRERQRVTDAPAKVPGLLSTFWNSAKAGASQATTGLPMVYGGVVDGLAKGARLVGADGAAAALQEHADDSFDLTTGLVRSTQDLQAEAALDDSVGGKIASVLGGLTTGLPAFIYTAGQAPVLGRDAQLIADGVDAGTVGKYHAIASPLSALMLKAPMALPVPSLAARMATGAMLNAGIIGPTMRAAENAALGDEYPEQHQPLFSPETTTTEALIGGGFAKFAPKSRPEFVDSLQLPNWMRRKASDPLPETTSAPDTVVAPERTEEWNNAPGDILPAAPQPPRPAPAPAPRRAPPPAEVQQGGRATAENAPLNLADMPDSVPVQRAAEADFSAVQGLVGQRTRITDPTGAKHEPEWRVVEAESLATRINEDVNQARDRNRAASQVQIDSIARALDYDLLNSAPTMNDGAPVVAQGGEIVGGNGRVAAIKKAYGLGLADNYRESLLADAASKGIDPASLGSFKQPVLVRVLPEGSNVREMALLSNEGGSLQMSAREQAKVDGERLGDIQGLKITDNGDLYNADNLPFFRRLVQQTPIAQRGGLTDAEGNISNEGRGRLRNAVLHRAYGDTDVLTQIIESPEPDSRNLVNALVRAAPRFAGLKQGMAKGDVYNADIVPDLLVAVNEYGKMLDKGLKVREYLAQMDAFNQLRPETQQLLQYIASNVRSAKKLWVLLDEYANVLEAYGNPKQADAFGDVPQPTPADVLTYAKQRVSQQAQPAPTNRTAAESRDGADPRGAEAGAKPADGGNFDGADLGAGDARDAGRVAPPDDVFFSRSENDRDYQDYADQPWLDGRTAQPKELTPEQLAEVRYKLRTPDDVWEDLFPAFDRPTQSQLKTLVDKVLADVTNGKIKTEEAVSKIAGMMQVAKANTRHQRELKADRDNVRGADFVREKLFNARRTDKLANPEIIDFTLWLIDKNPALANDLGLSIRNSTRADGNNDGNYSPGERLITIFRDARNIDTGVHELLHHTERMLPDAIQAGIDKLHLQRMFDGIEQARRDGRYDRVAALDTLLKMQMSPNKERRAFYESAVRSKALTGADYQFFNSSEFWAVNGTSLLKARWSAQNAGWLAKARNWLLELREKAKSVLGLDSNNAVIKGLDFLNEADGRYQPRQGSIASRSSLKEGIEPLYSFSDNLREFGDDMRSAGEHLGDAWKNRSILKTKPKFEVDEKGRPVLLPETTRDWWQRKYQDRFNRAQRAQDAVEATGQTVRDEADMRGMETLFYGKTADRIEREVTRFVEPLKQDLRDSKVSVEDLSTFMNFRHTPERNAQIAKFYGLAIRPNGTIGLDGLRPELSFVAKGINKSNRDAESYLAALDPALREKYEPLAERVYDILKRKQSIQQNFGLLDQKVIDAQNAAYKYYVPMKAFDPTEPVAKGKSSGFDVRGPENKRAYFWGSERFNSVAQAVADLNGAVARASKAEVGRSVLQFSLDHPDVRLSNGRKLMEVIEPSDQKLWKWQEDPITKKQVFALDPMWAKDAVMVKHGGKETALKINDRVLLSQIRRMGEADMPKWLQTVGTGTRAMAALNTSLSPDFWLTNFIRDLQSAGINNLADGSPVSTRAIVADAGRAMKGVFLREALGRDGGEWQRWYDDYKANGGQTGFYGLQNPDVILRDIRGDLERLGDGLGDRTYRGAQRVGDLVQAVNASFENALRLAAYKNAVQAGLTRHKAAKMAKEITVNFNKRGEAGAVLNSLYMFFNAAVQGNVRSVGAVMKSRTAQVVMANLMLLGAATGLMNSMWGTDETGVRHVDKISPYVRERNVVLMFAPDQYVKIPLPYVFNSAYVLGDRMVSAQQTGEWGNNMAAVVKSLAGAIDPFGVLQSTSGEGSRSVVAGLAPSVLDPVAQLAMNENAFGGKIVPQHLLDERGRPDSQKFNGKTWPWLKDAAERVNALSGGNEWREGEVDLSPAAVQHIVESYSGGTGRLVGQVSRLAQAGLDPEVEAKMRDVPILGKLYGVDDERWLAGKYWEAMNAADAMAMEYKANPDPKARAELQPWEPLMSMAPRAQYFFSLAKREGNEKELQRVQKRLVTEYQTILKQQRNSGGYVPDVD
jgi:hypothetical protein